jgi:hypothetical protein
MPVSYAAWHGRLAAGVSRLPLPRLSALADTLSLPRALTGAALSHEVLRVAVGGDRMALSDADVLATAHKVCAWMLACLHDCSKSRLVAVICNVMQCWLHVLPQTLTDRPSGKHMLAGLWLCLETTLSCSAFAWCAGLGGGRDRGVAPG